REKSLRRLQDPKGEMLRNTIQSTRGPRSLRPNTIRKIFEKQAQDGGANDEKLHKQGASPSLGGPSQHLFESKYPDSTRRADHDAALIEVLEIYRLRLYPIWPIVDVQELQVQLTSGDNPRSRPLATAMRLAATAQLRLESTSPEEVPRTSLEDGDGNVDLTCLRIAFFLHIYHENQKPGGGKSMLYLRQALTIAQVMRLDRESSYAALPEAEQQLRRRVLWLLFVTERGVSMLHKMPAILKPNIAFPCPGGDDQEQVLPAFLKLINLFFVFDQSGIFENLQNSDSDLSNMAVGARGCVDTLQRRLQDSTADYESSNDIQKADIYVTRQWMRAVLWRAAASFGLTSLASSPIRIAREFLSFVSHLPKAAIEAHGPTIEYKTYDIATAVIDAVTSNVSVNPADQPEEVLQGLQLVLSSSRGGNKALLGSLYLKMAAITPGPQVPLGLRGRVEEVPEDPGARSDRSPPHGHGILPSPWADLEDIASNTNFVRTPGSGTPNYHSLDQQNQQMSWSPLDLSTPLIRTPSPLTRAIFDQVVQGNSSEYLPSVVTSWNNPTP
ncbi:uncharacterized protein BCR38DRAFT_334977, partial [Pseudomassariella vexata]